MWEGNLSITFCVYLQYFLTDAMKYNCDMVSKTLNIRNKIYEIYFILGNIFLMTFFYILSNDKH